MAEKKQKEECMKRLLIEKTAVTIVLVLVWALGVKVGYREDGTIMEHVLWIVCHANFWHLCGNLFVFWLMSKRLYLVVSAAIAFLASWLPVLPGVWDLILAGNAVSTATMGFSGVLFAIIGVKWGALCRCGTTTYWTFCKRVLPFALVGVLIPHINWSIHTYCVLMGLAYGRWKG